MNVGTGIEDDEVTDETVDVEIFVGDFRINIVLVNLK